jgi:hypothetical protein
MIYKKNIFKNNIKQEANWISLILLFLIKWIKTIKINYIKYNSLIYFICGYKNNI